MHCFNGNVCWLQTWNRQPWKFTFAMQNKSLALLSWKIQISFLRHKSEQDQSDVCHGMKRAKEMLDKDSVFFWRLFQDIFKTSTINFTGISTFFCATLSDWQLSQDYWSYQMSAILWARRSSAKRIQTLPSSGDYCIITSESVESLAGVTWKAANTSATGAVSTWQRRNLWTTKCLFPLWPDWTGSMCWWKRLSRTQTRLLRKEERRSACASNHLICRFFFVD